ncbi:MAG: ATP-binding protein, partial [Deltaproteobacteria bacterium]
ASPPESPEPRVLIDLFGGGRGPEDRQNTEWMAIRTKWREGSVLVALDPDASLFWRLKTAVQQAIDEVGLGGETGFLMVTDEKGRRLGSMGRTPEDGADIIAPDHEGFRPEGIESRKVQLGEEKLLEISAPIRFQKGLSGVVRVGLSRESAEAMLSKEKGRGILWMSFMGVITLLSMWLLYKNQNRHLKRMREVEDRLNQARRLSAMGRMAAGVAHEIRNPLNAIGMASQRLSEKNVDQLSGVIRNEIRRLDQIIDDFLSLSRVRTTAYRPHDIKALMDQMALLLREESLSRGVRMICDWEDGPLLVSMDVDRMTQAIMNIVKNAVESISDEGIVTLSVEQESKDWVRIGVRDNGKGLGPEEMDRMFNPDYTTKEKGLGLGLPLANEIIRGHGGEIRVMSEPDKGTTVIIRLPLARIE